MMSKLILKTERLSKHNSFLGNLYSYYVKSCQLSMPPNWYLEMKDDLQSSPLFSDEL